MFGVEDAWVTKSTVLHFIKSGFMTGMATRVTIDSCNATNQDINVGFSETPSQHKSFNIIKLENGHFAAQPNNRVIWRDCSLIPDELKKPDFKVCTQNYAVETESKWWTVGHTDEWQYKTKGLIIDFIKTSLSVGGETCIFITDNSINIPFPSS